MSRYRLRQLAKYVPLHKRWIPPYPAYWKGNPQLRVHLPLFWMKLINPTERKQPPHVATFIVHPQMTKFDIKNYLEKIYKVPVDNIRTYNQRGGDLTENQGKGHNLTEKAKASQKKREDHVLGLEADSKFAYVELGEGMAFEFPDISEGREAAHSEELKQYKEATRQQKIQARKHWDKKDIPSWFH